MTERNDRRTWRETVAVGGGEGGAGRGGGGEGGGEVVGGKQFEERKRQWTMVKGRSYAGIKVWRSVDYMNKKQKVGNFPSTLQTRLFIIENAKSPLRNKPNDSFFYSAAF